MGKWLEAVRQKSEIRGNPKPSKPSEVPFEGSEGALPPGNPKKQGDAERPCSGPHKTAKGGEADPTKPTKAPSVSSVGSHRGAFANNSTLLRAVDGLDLTAESLYQALAPEDLEAIEAGEIGEDALRAFAQALVDTRAREAGKVPEGWDQAGYCRLCGHVWLWAPFTVDGCPWCHNRIRGLPVPRPHPQEETNHG